MSTESAYLEVVLPAWLAKAKGWGNRIDPDTDTATVTGEVKRETEKAILLKRWGNDPEQWIPKSQIIEQACGACSGKGYIGTAGDPCYKCQPEACEEHKTLRQEYITSGCDFVKQAAKLRAEWKRRHPEFFKSPEPRKYKNYFWVCECGKVKVDYWYVKIDGVMIEEPPEGIWECEDCDSYYEWGT